MPRPLRIRVLRQDAFPCRLPELTRLSIRNRPDNPGDLYELPQPVMKAIRGYLQADFPVRLDAPARVSLFAYDNDTFIVESFRSEPASVGVFVSGGHT